MKKIWVAARWQVLALALAAALLVPAAAQATPTFLTAIDVSDAGQDAFEPEVAVDSSGNSLMVWTRSDGSNLRTQAKFRAADGTGGPPATISQAGRDASEPQVAFDPSRDAIAVWSQFDGAHSRIHAAFRPAGGSFGGDQTISPGGANANAPQIAFDSTGKAVAVWYRFDGTTDRIQVAVRPVGGSFGAAQTLSGPGVEAFEPRISAGPNADANGVVVWTGSDGTNLRVQSSRRRDVAGYVRPQAAGPLYIPMVPAYNQCLPASANRTHGPSLGFPSCNPPVRNSTVVTMGSPDANGFAANGTGFVRYTGVIGNVATEADEADVKLTSTIKDVRNNPSGSDYTGQLLVHADLQITDKNNAAETPEPATTVVLPYEYPVSCVATADVNVGGTCSIVSTADAIVPGTILESMRTVWQVGPVQVKDAGPDGIPGNGDDSIFLRQGIFVP